MGKTKPELILPGGDPERAKIALDFGADAVYVGLNKHSLRKGEVRFEIPEIKEVIEYAHSKDKRCYVTFNIFAHNRHLSEIKRDIKKIAKLKPDAFIVADPGVLQIARKLAPKIPLHVSTQANVTNTEQVRFYQEMGVKRVVLARELTLDEIKKIHKEVPEMELEIFVHGSMCISYSGRCLLSAYMTGRKANLGDCAQPCRWNYDVYLEEKERPGELFPIEETKEGSNILSSRDLAAIEYIDEIIEAGVTGLKVEGRNKTEYYLASTALAYREALDLAMKDKYKKADKERLKKELEKIAHRGYTSGFLLKEAQKGEVYPGRSPIEKWRYAGQITKNTSRKENRHEITVKNRIRKGAEVEVLTPKGIKKDKILEIKVDNKSISEISPGKKDQTALVVLKRNFPKNSLIRVKIRV